MYIQKYRVHSLLQPHHATADFQHFSVPSLCISLSPSFALSHSHTFYFMPALSLVHARCLNLNLYPHRFSYYSNVTGDAGTGIFRIRPA